MFSALPETVKNQLVEADYSTDLQCEISDPHAKECCYKDGVEFVSKSLPHIISECTRRTLAVKTAQPSSSGWYDSVRTGEVIQLNVQDQGDFQIFAFNLFGVFCVATNHCMLLLCSFLKFSSNVCW